MTNSCSAQLRASFVFTALSDGKRFKTFSGVSDDDTRHSSRESKQDMKSCPISHRHRSHVKRNSFIFNAISS